MAHPGRRGLDLDWIERPVARRESGSTRAPITADVGPGDAIVAADAAIYEDHRTTRHRVIASPQLGMAVSPRTRDLLIDALRVDRLNDPKRELAA